MVYISCTTYNHASYIEDALKGFYIQKTNFPFAAIVIDDASTDNEQELLLRFVNEELDPTSIEKEETDDYIKIAGLHKNNQNCTFVILLLKYNHRSIKKAKSPYFEDFYKGIKYAAMCEGDDYWIDPMKLQKQVDYLNSHSDCGLVYTDFNIYNQENNNMEYSLIGSGKYPQILDFQSYLSKLGYIAPMSWVFRKGLIDYKKNCTLKIILDGTFVMALEFFLHSKVHYINDVTCVYRLLKKSASHPNSVNSKYRYYKNLHDIQIYYGDKYLVPENIKKSFNWFYKDYAIYIIALNDHKEILNLKSYYNNNNNLSLRHKLYKIIIKYNWGEKLLRFYYLEKLKKNNHE